MKHFTFARLVASLLLLAFASLPAEAQFRLFRRWGPPAVYAPPANVAPAAIKAEKADALDEVNAARLVRGLKPFAKDDALTVAALAAAKARAATLRAGHTANDFAYLPKGATAKAAGCAAWGPTDGWGSCCTYGRYACAGAAWVIGADNRKYMHLFVR